jgi:formylglycine-generating enzyme
MTRGVGWACGSQARSRSALLLIYILTVVPACESRRHLAPAPAATAPPPSCAAGGPGMTDCGASRESCCTSLEVPGGTYFRTYKNSGNCSTEEADPATVSTFRLDKYLVTVGRFRKFVNAVAHAMPGHSYAPTGGSGKHTHLNGGKGLVAVGGDAGVAYETGWVAPESPIAPSDDDLACPALWWQHTWTPSPGAHENLPITCVNWWEAYAFCIWDGGFLPSEAEWEYAAAGGGQQRAYPWGSFYDNYYANDSHDFAPVGTVTRGAGRWGQLDLDGEIREWNLDWNAKYMACADCAYLATASERVIRGRPFANAAPNVDHHSYSRVPTAHGVGFRCARAPRPGRR